MKYLKSRTIITAVLLFVYGGFANIEGVIGQEVHLLIMGVLTALIAFFRTHPIQKF